jgi:flagellar biosynthesis protein FliQ
MGAIPMLLACMAVYKFNGIKTSLHKKRNFTLIFLPGFVCTGCMLYVIGVVVLGYLNMFISGIMQ